MFTCAIFLVIVHSGLIHTFLKLYFYVTVPVTI